MGLTTFTQEVADVICDRIATSTLSIKNICESDEHLPNVSTVLRWLRTNEEFRTQYTRAKEEQADMLIEEMIDIADDGSNDLMTVIRGDKEYEQENKEVTSRSKLRVETRKWIAAKLKPKKYGDKLDVTSDNKPLAPTAFKVEIVPPKPIDE